MVRALLAGSKTQTRRVCKPQPHSIGTADKQAAPSASPYGIPGDRLWVRETFFAYGRWETRFNDAKQRDEMRFVDMTAECGHAYHYDADAPALPLAPGPRGPLTGWYKRPALFMPRAASRIALELVSVRVEQLNDCSPADAMAEGLQGISDGIGWNAGDATDCALDPVARYAALWDMINGSGSWAKNPWIWVVEFRRVGDERQA